MVTRDCVYCGKEFLTHSCWIKRGRGKFCSKQCNAKYNYQFNEKFKLTKGMLGKKKTVVNNCKCFICGKELFRYPSKLKKITNSLCSRECFKKFK
jgi:hypothetical protein